MTTPPLKAGFAEVDISPPLGTQIAGDIGRLRPTEEIRTPIFARAAVFVQGEVRLCVLLLPVPFTLAVLSVARPIDATNVLGLPLIFGFSFGVWVFHTRWRWPIVVAIATAVAGYGVIGAGVARLDLGGAAAFWIAEAATMAVALALIRVLPPSDDPHTQTPLPVWVKLPAIALTVAMVIAIKPWLSGFMTMFPMVLGCLLRGTKKPVDDRASNPMAYPDHDTHDGDHPLDAGLDRVAGRAGVVLANPAGIVMVAA